MTRWQRRLRFALGAFVLLFAGFVYLAMRTHAPAPKKPTATPPMVDPNAQSQATSGKRLQFKQGALDYTLYYQVALGYAEGNSKFRGVRALAHRQGRDIEITGDEAAVAADESTARFTGHVQLKSSDGLVLTMPEASYTKAEGVVRSRGTVEFTRGAVRGSAVGMTYDEKNDVLTLLEQVAMASDGSDGQPPTDVRAGMTTWARNEKYSRYEHGARIVRGRQTFEADTIVAWLTPDEQHLQRLEMQGNARIVGEPATATTAGTTSGTTLRGMRARDINLTYGPDGEKLQQAVLAGGSSVEVASGASAAVTRITGEFIDFGLDADGTTMQSLSARGATPAARAQLELPAQADAPPRAVRAASIQGPSPGATAKPGHGLTTLRFTDAVEYRETPAPPASPRVATSRLLDLTVQPGLGALEEARFSGNATLKEGTALEASARDAQYNVKAGTFEFTGPDDQGRPPQVKDQDQATIQGTRIVVKPEARKVLASGAVQSTIQASHKQADGKTVRTSAILSQDQPTLATSDELDYDGAASHAVFTSKAQSRLWQAQGNSVYGTTIVVDDTKGDLSAKGSVVSTLKLEQVDAKTKKKEIVNSTVHADTMAYDDAAHRATYVGHVHMAGGPQGDMKADKIEMFLSDTGDALQRLEADGNVEAEDPGTEKTGRRRTTGDHLVYLAADESYKVTGKLVKITEQCFGETLCHTLTFYRSVDRMVVDGNMKRRTQTKGGQGCK